jgi:hypothetical protein
MEHRSSMKMLLLTIYIWVVLHIISLDLSVGWLTDTGKTFFAKSYCACPQLDTYWAIASSSLFHIACHVYFNLASQLTISHQGYDPQLNTWLCFLRVTLWHDWSQPPFSHHTSHLSLTSEHQTHTSPCKPEQAQMSMGQPTWAWTRAGKSKQPKRAQMGANNHRGMGLE